MWFAHNYCHSPKTVIRSYETEMIVAVIKPVTLHWRHHCACKEQDSKKPLCELFCEGLQKRESTSETNIPDPQYEKKKSQPYKTELKKDDSKHTKIFLGALETWS